MEIRKSNDGEIESSIYNFLFYNHSNASELSNANSSGNVFGEIGNLSKFQSFSKTEDESIIFNNYDDNLKFPETTHAEVQHKNEGFKESTRKLLNLLERISCDPSEQRVSNEITPCVSKPIKCHDDGEECTVYNRLTRRCQCLNNSVYNDLILHFNEHTKYSTCDVGEIIKNMRIVKRFLYMGDGYTRNALLFLREGLTQSLLSEKAEIVHGCTHVDICNIFEDHSVVTMFIIWPCKYKTSGDYMIQVLTGILLYTIARTEEGKRYLNLNSKIAYDIKNTLKRHSTKLNKETVENLNNTLNLLEVHFAKQYDVSCCGKRNDKGIETQTLLNLISRRKQMTMSEVALSLEILKNCSKQKQCKLDLTEHLPQLLLVLKKILIDYDCSEINITTTDILRNVISKSTMDGRTPQKCNKTTVINIATEPIRMKDEFIQVKEMKIKKQKRKVEDTLWHSLIREKSKKTCDKTRNQTIIVPVD